MSTYGGLYAWEFEKGGRQLLVRVDGQIVMSTASMIADAALDGSGIGILPFDTVRPPRPCT